MNFVYDNNQEESISVLDDFSEEDFIDLEKEYAPLFLSALTILSDNWENAHNLPEAITIVQPTVYRRLKKKKLSLSCVRNFINELLLLCVDNVLFEEHIKDKVRVLIDDKGEVYYDLE